MINIAREKSNKFEDNIILLWCVMFWKMMVCVPLIYTWTTIFCFLFLYFQQKNLGQCHIYHTACLLFSVIFSTKKCITLWIIVHITIQEEKKKRMFTLCHRSVGMGWECPTKEFIINKCSATSKFLGKK